MAGLDRINGPDMVPGNNITRRIGAADNREQSGFSLPDEQDHEGVIYEPSSLKKDEKPKTLAQTREEIAREEAALAKKNLHSRFDGPGVEVELSAEAVKKAETGDKPETLGDILGDLFKGIRDFFRALWLGPEGMQEQSADTADAVTVEEAADDIYDSQAGEAGAVAEQADTDEEQVTADIPQSTVDKPQSAGAMSNDPDSIAAFMVNYGGRHLAKNSDLLTQYDRNGQIVSPNASDRRRILQGKGDIRRY